MFKNLEKTIKKNEAGDKIEDIVNSGKIQKAIKKVAPTKSTTSSRRQEASEKKCPITPGGMAKCKIGKTYDSVVPTHDDNINRGTTALSAAGCGIAFGLPGVLYCGVVAELYDAYLRDKVSGAIDKTFLRGLY